MPRVYRGVLVFLGLVVAVAVAVPRKPVVHLLSVHRVPDREPDLIVVLGGGMYSDGSPGRSTQERLEMALAYGQELSVPILVAEYPAGRTRMGDYLVDRGILRSRLVQSSFRYDEAESGTVNNVRDVLAWVAANPDTRTVVVVTSPYHQRRVDLIWRQEAPAFRVAILPRYLDIPDGGEIMTCSRGRFLELVFHEVGGLLHRTLVKR